MQPNFSLPICALKSVAILLSLLGFCGWFDWSPCGACTFDSLAVWITIPRFSVCVCVCVCACRLCAILNCHIFFYARRRRIALAAGTDWYAATDNVSLSFNAHAAEMKSKPALRAMLSAHTSTWHLAVLVGSNHLFLFFVYWNNYREYFAVLDFSPLFLHKSRVTLSRGNG